MTVEAWPGTLPQKPLDDGWSFQPMDSRVFFEAEIGPPITAPRGTAVGATAQYLFVMTLAQIAIFEAFYTTTLNNGTKAFTLYDPMADDDAVFKFDKSPYSVKPHSLNAMAVSCNLVRLS